MKLVANLTTKQESFVKLANAEGFTDKITRKDIISLQSKHGITKPAWLMKNTITEWAELHILYLH